MTHDIVCVTYVPDAPWVVYLLRSLKLHARGFRQLVLVCPEQGKDLFTKIAKPFPFARLVFRPEPSSKGHRHQMVLKCQADLLSNADVFHHIDSDCHLVGPWTPEDSMTDGKPDLLFTSFANLKPGDSPWRGITENSLKARVPWETMRRFPFVYPRFLYGALRQHIERVQHMPFDQWVFTAPNVGPAWHGFSEFCALGAFGMIYHPGAFHLYNTITGMKPTNVRQSWSHHIRDNATTEWPAVEARLKELTKGWESAKNWA